MNFPLLCFNGVYTQTNVQRLLNAITLDSQSSIKVSESTIYSWRIGANTTCYDCIIRVPGGKAGFITEVSILSETFKGPILLFDRTIKQSDISDNMYIVDNIEILEVMLNIHISPQNKEALRKLLLEDYKPIKFPTRVPQGQEEMAYADRFIEAMREGRHIEPPDAHMFTRRMVLHNPTVLMTPTDVTIIEGSNEDDDDIDFLRAQDESLHHHDGGGGGGERTQKTRKLNPEWNAVLKTSEIAVTGDPICVACHEMRASILFIQCSHQVMCDNCVRKMFELPGVERTCPVCREPCDQLNRPYLAERAK